MRIVVRLVLVLSVALAIMASCAHEGTTSPEIQHHEEMILRVENLYKQGKLGENSSDLTPTVAFFDSLAQRFPKHELIRFDQAKAYYYLGTQDIFRQQDVKAASDFVTALKIMQNVFPETKDSLLIRFKGLANFRLGEILIAYNIQSAAVDVFESAKTCFARVDDTLGIAASIRNVGEIYQSNKDYEKALAKFQEANRLWDFGDQLYDHSVGGIFFEHQQMDSASAYLERSFLSSGPYARIDAAAKLAEIYRLQGDKEKENYYTVFYVQNSIREANRSSDKMEIEFIVGSLNAPTSEPHRNSNLGLILMIVVAVLVVFLLTTIIIHNRHRITSIEQHLSNMEQTQPEETVEKTRPDLPAVNVEEAFQAFSQSPIAKKIHKAVDGKDIMTKSVSLYPQLKLSEVDFIEVVSAANKNFPQFSSRLLGDYKNLSTADVRHCCLALMGLNDAEIAALEGITYSGANRRTNRILTIMNGNAGLAECVLLYLRSLYG